MTVETIQSFDIAIFKRAYEEWDIAPRTRHGRDILRGMLEHCAGAGVVATVENTVAGEQRAAATITCEFPGGRRVLANAALEIEDGRIVRELDVLSGDPKGA
jgi:hypothetical protein